jgi:FkbM family methyltransferase
MFTNYLRIRNMSLGQKIINYIEKRRDRRRKCQLGAVGQFWRDGGNELLYDLPVTTGSLVIDAGGYKGEWSSGMISRYGCKCVVYEPVPAFAEHCTNFFKNNKLVQIYKAALGGADRKTTFNLLDNGTSEYRGGDEAQHIEVNVVDVARIFADLEVTRVACCKLNIEGGEYEVLERILETDNIALCDSLLIQFHRQPEGYEARYKNIVAVLHKTHIQSWSYEMVWEKWVLKDGRS